MYKRIFLSVIIVIFIGNSYTLIAQNLTGEEKEWLAKASRIDKNGWIYLHIEGRPFERGFQRGYLTANEIDDFFALSSCHFIACKANYDLGRDGKCL